MAFSELIKSFDRIRDYMRDFYVYGFKSRSEYNAKSARSYDNEKRRLESWLGDYMGFRMTSSGKNVFLSIDSRTVKHNPLYKAFKTKSFTDGDITLHFILFDILYDPGVKKTVSELCEEMDTRYLSRFEEPMMFDESTVRKKLKEYEDLGIIKKEKSGRKTYYSRTENTGLDGLGDAVAFFSEAGLAGVLGSTLLDKGIESDDIFSFKHHYITHTLESEILCSLFEAMGEKRRVRLKVYSRKQKCYKQCDMLPLRIFVSVQTGRRYVVGKNIGSDKMFTLRLDYIVSVEKREEDPDFDAAREKLSGMQSHMWGVGAVPRKREELDHVEFDVCIPESERFIWKRLEREKRCGKITRIDDTHARFECDVYDSSEMIPWIRSLICRISNLHFSNAEAEKLFREDIDAMCAMYGVGGDDDAV